MFNVLTKLIGSFNREQKRFFWKTASRLVKKGGFSLIEMMLVMIVIGVLLSVVLSGKGVADTSRVSSSSQSIKALHNSSMSYMTDNLTYTGVSVASLIAGEYLPTGFDATGSNPFGGNYAVAPNSGDSTQVDISLTNVTAGNATKLNNMFANSSNGTNYDAGSSTWTVTF